VGKKIKLNSKIICLAVCLALGQTAEVGQVTALRGEVYVSRNLEYTQPIIASRIYTNDLILLEDNAFVKIESPRRIWQISGPAKVAVTPAGRFQEEYGTLSWRRKRSADRSLPLAIGYTMIFPGAGHWYIDDYFKAVPMLAASTWLIWSILSNNPEYSKYPEAAAQNRQNYQQIYLVYLIAAVLDVWSETNNLNKQAREIAKLAEDD